MKKGLLITALVILGIGAAGVGIGLALTKGNFKAFDRHGLLKVQSDPVRRIDRGRFKAGVPVGVQVAVAGAVRLVAWVLAVDEDLDFADVRPGRFGRLLSLCAVKRRGESAERQRENQNTVCR